MQVGLYEKYFSDENVVGWDGGETDRVVKSASRALKILELFDVLKREALVSEVSELLELPQSSTSVLLRSLVIIGYLHYNPETRAYSPTTRVALLGNWINGPMLCDGPLVRFMHRLNARTGQAIVLAATNQIWSQYIHVLQATDPVRIFLVKGTKRPLARSATGVMLMTDMLEAQVKRVCTRYNAERPDDGDVVNVANVVAQVAQARRDRYAVTDGAVTPGAGMIAMKLPRLDSSEQFVVGLAAVSEVMRDRQEEFITIMREEIVRFTSSSIEVHQHTDRLAG